ncbi:MAG: flagellar basal body P-ring formation protein FlgA [Burkholderiales bacterium]|jgi:flagella basal body P-ring formation protein FlgA|nr:flagellar basal body P-ring formation protein FlgA [Burkholderiales bacterium]MBP6249874.1 flagellar basal body P-ring formation protein FlgA [Leptothrix sp. (in: b-proteobacteria)]MBP7519725.1 flagellar basal body P-ring formation protein FlgA [Leptothrix sp. (in: b-proteobacteria)]
MPAPASAPPAVPRWAAALCLAGAATLTWAQSPPPSAVALPATSLPTLALGPGAAQQGAAGLAEAVGAALALAVRHVQTPAGARLEVEPGQLDPRLKLAACSQVEPYLPTHSRLWGRTRIGLRCLSGPVRWNVYLPVTVKVWARAVVAAQPLTAGNVIKPSDLGWADVDLAAHPSAAQLDPAPLIGRSLAVHLPYGAAIRADSLRQRQWFAAGEVVSVIARGPGYAVSGSATALSHGIEGQPVRLRTEAGRIITATPTGERRVELEL